MQSSALPHATSRWSGSAAAVLPFSMFGVRIEVRVEDASLVERIQACLPSRSGADASARIDRTYEILSTLPGLAGTASSDSRAADRYLLADRALVGQSSDVGTLCDHFQSDLERFLARRARTHAFVEAGVVGWQGRGIVIPGRRVSGKTTLVDALVRQGADYYSDQYAVLDPNGLVSPFRPSFDERNAQLPQDRSSGEFGGPARPPIPVGYIVVAEYKPGAVWHPHRLTPGQAVVALLSHAPAARHQPGYLLRTFKTAARSAVTWSGTRGDATAFATHLLNEVAAASRSRRS